MQLRFVDDVEVGLELRPRDVAFGDDGEEPVLRIYCPVQRHDALNLPAARIERQRCERRG
jgi:hypothetical protein